MADIYLRHFGNNEIVITPEDAAIVLQFYFGNDVPSAAQLSTEDVAFAQALLLEGIDKSYAMGYAHILFDCFYMKVPGSFASVREMAEDFAKKATKHWFDHAAGKDLSKPEIYAAVRATIAANFRSVWAIRMQGGGLTY